MTSNRNSKGKTYEEMYGIEKAKQAKDKMRISTKDNIEKMRLWHLGRKQTEEEKNKRKETIKRLYAEGKIKQNYHAWNKGLTKETDDRIKKGSEKLIGHKMLEENKRKLLLANLGRKHSNQFKEDRRLCLKKAHAEGRFKNVYNEEFKEKARLGHIGKKHSDATRKKQSQAREFIISPKKDTSIEKKIQSFLDNLEIEYLAHKFMHIEHGYQADIFIPSLNLVIECDGDYWHGNPLRNKELSEKQKAQRIKDEARTKELKEHGYKVIRLWEHEIKAMTLEEFNHGIFST